MNNLETNTKQINISKKTEYLSRIKKTFREIPWPLKIYFQTVGVLIIFALVVFFTENSSSSIPSVSGVTSSSKLNFFIVPDETTMYNDDVKYFEASVSSSVPISFIHIEVNFDKTKVNIDSSPQVEGPLTRVVLLSSASEANSSGVVKIVLALDPLSGIDPPSGEFIVATIPFKVVTPTENDSTELYFNDTNTYAVSTTSEYVIFSSYGSVIDLNIAVAPPTSRCNL